MWSVIDSRGNHSFAGIAQPHMRQEASCASLLVDFLPMTSITASFKTPLLQPLQPSAGVLKEQPAHTAARASAVSCVTYGRPLATHEARVLVPVTTLVKEWDN